MCQVYCQHFEGKGEENAGLGKDIAVKYFRLAEALYYKTLEAVIDQEKERLGDTDLSVSPTCATLLAQLSLL
jgi:hypothetical protein